MQQYKVVSLFSGCGGSSLGYKLAGFKVLLANEFVPAARDTYKMNFPDTILLDSDVRKTTGDYILERINIKKGELDLLDGSPPCSAFSPVGKRNESWGKQKEYSDKIYQRVDDLYFEFIRLIREIKPKVFLSENVPNITYGMNKGYFNEIFKEMQKSDYIIKACILSSKYFNVAQDRKRLFFMGIRKDISENNNNILPSFPKQVTNKSNLLTCWDVLKDVKNNEWELKEASRFTAYNSLKWLKLLKEGQSCGDIHPNGSYFSLKRISMKKQAQTVTTLSIGHANRDHKRSGLCHSTENRYLTISELKRISSFPDDFILTGNFSQQWERIARAVPPNFMKALAIHIRDNILNKINNINNINNM